MRKLLIVIVFLILIGSVYAGDEDINLSSDPVRTLPCFEMGNRWYGEVPGPVSATSKWFWAYETPNTYPTGSVAGQANYGPITGCRGEVGREYVYGLVSSLLDPDDEVTAGVVTTYKTNVKTLPAGCTPVTGGRTHLFWDKTDDSTLYASCNDGTIKKIDFDAGSPAWSTVCDWSTLGKNANGFAYTNIYGWMYGTDKLAGLFGQRMWDPDLDLDGYVDGRPGVAMYDTVSCDVSDGTEDDTPEAGDTIWTASYFCLPGNVYSIGNLPLGKNGHWALATDSNVYAATYGSGTGNNGVHHGALTDGGKCTPSPYFTSDGDPFSTVEEGQSYSGHVNWLNDPDWYIVDLFEINTGLDSGISPKAGIAQYYFDRGTGTFTEARRVLTHPSARAWLLAGDQINYSAILLPSMNIDGSSVEYTATHGKYTNYDYVLRGYAAPYYDWEYITMWVAPVTVEPTDPPDPPTISTAFGAAVTGSTITAGGSILSDGGDPVEACGIVWGESAEPTLGVGNYTDEIADEGCDVMADFVSVAASLEPCTYYHYRAYATNASGANTTYGADRVVKVRGACVDGDWTQGSIGSTLAVVVSAKDGGGEESGATTAAVDTTGANLIVVAVSTAQDITPVVSDNKANEWTALTATTQDYVKSQLFYAVDPVVGSGHTFNATGWVSSIYVLALSGASITSPMDQQNGNGGVGTTLATGSVTPTTNNQVLVASLSFDTTGTPISIDDGFTLQESLDWSSGNYRGGGIAYKVQTTAGAENPTWTRTNSQSMAARIATFKGAIVMQDYWYTSTAVKPHKVKDGATVLTEEDALEDVGDGEWYWDDATDRLYVQTDGSNPAALNIRCNALGVPAAMSLLNGVGQ